MKFSALIEGLIRKIKKKHVVTKVHGGCIPPPPCDIHNWLSNGYLFSFSK